MIRVALIGGPFSGQHTNLTSTPPVIEIGGVRYTRIDDPDTGESLGGYFHDGETDERRSTTVQDDVRGPRADRDVQRHHRVTQ